MQQRYSFGYFSESLIYPLLLLLILWLVQWLGSIYTFDFYKLGLLPRTLIGLRGILFMPLLHSQHDLHHLINNSVVVYLLLALLVYFYRSLALRVFIFCWLLTGFFVWIYAQNRGAYHIGMSGVIYALLGFLFTFGILQKHLPLQALSLLIVFLYGNMIWGIFPIRANVSWEGHFMGLVAGIFLAFIYRTDSIEEPKYQYEIDEALELNLNQTSLPIEEAVIEGESKSNNTTENQTSTQNTIKIVYHYKSSK